MTLSSTGWMSQANRNEIDSVALQKDTDMRCFDSTSNVKWQPIVEVNQLCNGSHDKSQGSDGDKMWQTT